MEEHSAAFWKWSNKLGELIFWAREAEPATAIVTTRDGWRDAFKDAIRDDGKLALDAAQDDGTSRRVIESQKLALQLVRMLHGWARLNNTPCGGWPEVDRVIVERLIELQAAFTKLGNGELPPPTPIEANVTPQTHDNRGNVQNSLPQNSDVRDLCLHLKAKLSEYPSMAACARDFCSKNDIDEGKSDVLLRQAKRFPHLWKS